MSEDEKNEQPDSGAPRDPDRAGSPGEPATPADRGVTEGGYSYTVVDDEGHTEPATPVQERQPRERAGDRGISPLLLAALAIVPALIVGVAVWFVVSEMDGGGSDDDRLSRNVTNVVNAFSQTGDGGPVIRYEGSLPPAFPDDVPLYPDGRIISSVVQIRGDDAGYIAVFDTDDSRQDVSNYFSEALNEDPWQVEIEQVGRESTVHQFSNVENPDIQGVVLAAESKDDEVTTIFMSVQVVGAAAANELEDFDPGDSRPLPAGFPADEVPTYPDSTVIETGRQQQAGARQYIISMLTEDDAGDVMSFYREQLESSGWTVEDAPPGSSSLEGGEALTFTGEDGETSGSVEAGAFELDDAYTRINIQVASPQ